MTATAAPVPSATDTTAIDQLIAIWSRTLPSEEPITADSNFFELGGDSLLAVNLFLEIERTTGHHLPITAIYDAPTVAELAALMAEEAPAKFNPLVHLKEGGAGEPLFIVHGVGGTVFDLAPLGKEIESDGPVYAIQARGIDGQDTPITSIHEMADYYVEAIRDVTNGPYRLAGYSFGGMVAVEMARRLGAENVETLILLDSFAHPQTWPKASRYQVRAAKLLRQIRNKAKNPRDLLNLVSRKLRRSASAGQQDPANDNRLVALRDWLGTVRADLPAPLREARIAGSKALLAYWPKPYAGKVTFLKARAFSDTFPMSPRGVWQNQVAGMDVRMLSGSHASIVNEDAAGTAAIISELLAKNSRQPFAASVSGRANLQLVQP
jgi:acetoacetyl-CoA synthetase